MGGGRRESLREREREKKETMIEVEWENEGANIKQEKDEKRAEEEAKGER